MKRRQEERERVGQKLKNKMRRGTTNNKSKPEIQRKKDEPV